MVTRPDGPIGGFLFDAFGTVLEGLGAASSAIGIDASASASPGHPLQSITMWPIMSLGAGSLLLDAAGI